MIDRLFAASGHLSTALMAYGVAALWLHPESWWAAAVVYFAPLVGRTVGPLRPPRWALVAGAVAFAAFAVLRNLPVAGLEFLGSGTS